MSKKESLLIDPENPDENEFFRLRQIFREISQNPEHSEIVKLQLLMRKASDLYNYLQKVGINVKEIKAWRYKPGKLDPVADVLAPDDVVRAADKAFKIHCDYDIARRNFLALRDAYMTRLQKFKVYEPLFDEIMMLLAQLKPHFKKISNIGKSDNEKRKISKELSDVRKQNLYLEENIKDLKKQLEDKDQAWEISVSETFANISQNFERWKFLASLPMWEELKPEDVGMISKIVAYCVIRGTDTITADEIVKKLKIENVTAVANLPFMEFIGRSKIRLDYDGLKTHLAKKKIDFSVDKKGWMVSVKDAISKYGQKLKAKISKK